MLDQNQNSLLGLILFRNHGLRFTRIIHAMDTTMKLIVSIKWNKKQYCVRLKKPLILLLNSHRSMYDAKEVFFSLYLTYNLKILINSSFIHRIMPFQKPKSKTIQRQFWSVLLVYVRFGQWTNENSTVK